MPDSAGPLRRTAALLYDGVAALAVAYFAAFVPVLVSGGSLAPGNWLFLLYVIGTVYGYFALCWARGRTLGMQAWRLVVVDADGGTGIGWRQSAVRFAAAALSTAAAGLGFAWMLVDPERCTWHDRLSRSRLVYRPASAANGSGHAQV